MAPGHSTVIPGEKFLFADITYFGLSNSEGSRK